MTNKILVALMAVSIMTSCNHSKGDINQEERPKRVRLIEGHFSNLKLYNIDGVEYVCNTNGGIMRHEPNKTN
jgi:hypothetical protein